MTESASPPATRKPGVYSGLYCITGTRIPVATVVGMWMSGVRLAEIAGEYPHVSLERIEDALRWWSNRTKPLRAKILRRKA